MTLILLEALGAGLLLVLIVWWTMFSGRDRGEPPPETVDAHPTPESHAASAASDRAAQPSSSQGPSA